MQEHVADRFVRRARAQGRRSRAAFKLEEIARRDRLLEPGMTVVDLGAAPGGWSQVAAEKIGPRGRVVAVDMLDMAGIAGVRFIRGDFREVSVVTELEQVLSSHKVDLVLSDMSPNISGIASADQARALALAGLARDFALKHLKPQGNLLLKMFQGAGYETFLKELRGAFREVMVRKPEASRERSSEVYLVAKGLKETTIERGSVRHGAKTSAA